GCGLRRVVERRRGLGRSTREPGCRPRYDRDRRRDLRASQEGRRPGSCRRDRQAAVAVRCHARELLVVPQAPSRDGGTDAGGAHVVELRAWCRTLALRLRLQDGVRYAVTAEVANSPSRWAELAGRTR